MTSVDQIYADYCARMKNMGITPADETTYLRETAKIYSGTFEQQRQHSRLSRLSEILSRYGFAAVLVVLLLASLCPAQVAVSAQLTDGQGNTQPGSYLHFQLQNCGNNFPTFANPGPAQNPWTVVRTAFDLKPNQSDGSIVGSVIGNDQILCGNVASTFYQVTIMKNGVTPLAPVTGQPFVICTVAAPNVMPCSNTGLGTWNPVLQQPAFQPVAPGYVQLFQNPLSSQVWVQPISTKATFFGTFDFTHATVLGIGGTITGATPNGGLLLTGTTLGLRTDCSPSQVVQWSGTAWNCANAGAGTVTGPTTHGGIVATGTTLGLPLNCLNAQVMQWNNTDWVCATVSSGGTVTGATSGGGLALTGSTLGLRVDCSPNQSVQWSGTAWVCFTPGAGSLTGATTHAGLVVTSTTVGLPLTCSINQTEIWNGTDWVCGSPAASGIVASPVANQDIVQPKGTEFSTNNLANARYVSVGSSWNWKQLPGDDLSTPGAKTLHLSPCPIGIDVSNTSSRPYYAYISTVGTPEAVQVTGGTCTSGGASGTILVTTVNVHLSGYSVGSSTAGIQEAINDTLVAGPNVSGSAVILMPNTNTTTYDVFATIYAQTSKLILRGEGKPTIRCFTRSVCLFVGDRSNSNFYNGMVVDNIRFAAGNTFDGIKGLTFACSANTATITFTNTGSNAIAAGDYFDVMFWGNPSAYAGIHQAASSSSTQITYAFTNCGGAGTIASAAGYGGLSLENAAVEDNGNGTAITNIYISDVVSTGLFGRWQNFIVVDNDQAFKLDTYDGDEGPHCTANYCGQAIYAPGPFSINAAVLWLSHMQMSLGCQGSGVTDFGGNTLHISNSVIQGFALWGVYGGTPRGGFGPAQFDDVYEEVGGCSNPFYANSMQAETGYFSGGISVIHGGEFPIGQMPRFGVQGNNGTTYQYAIVVQDTSVGRSATLKIGYATVDSVSPSGSIVVQWPRVFGTGTVTYDVLRYTPNVSGVVIEPYFGACGGGSPTACGSVAVGVAQCSAIVCSFTDTASAATTSYTVNAPQNQVGVNFWPGGLVVAASADKNNTWDSLPTYLDTTNFITPISPIISMLGTNVPQVFALRCDGLSANVWLTCLGGNSSGNNGTPAATMLQMGGATGGLPTSNLKGRLWISGGPQADVGNSEVITLGDCNAGKTLATPNGRPSADTCDTYLGFDNANTSYNFAQLAINSPVSISQYINSLPDNASWKTRLTSALWTSKVPLSITGGITLTGLLNSAAVDQALLSSGSAMVNLTLPQGALAYDQFGTGTQQFRQAQCGDMLDGCNGTGTFVKTSPVNPIIGATLTNPSANNLTISGTGVPSQLDFTPSGTACSAPASGHVFLCSGASGAFTISLGAGNAFTPGPSSAPLFAECGGSLGGSTNTDYIFFPAQQSTTTCTASALGATAQEVPAPAAGTLQNFQCTSNGGGTAGDTIKVWVNNTATTMIAAIGTGTSASDTTHTAPITAGQGWSIRYHTNGATDAATGMRCSVEFVRTP